MMSQYTSGNTITAASDNDRLNHIRLDTSYSLSYPDSMVSLRIGDTLTSSQPWSRATRIGGIQLARNFALQPYRITSPTPALMGTSALPSDIALFINGVQQYQGKLPAGPFTLNTPTGITGTGAAQVVLTDSFGRTSTLQYDFYGATALLAKGLSDWSGELGVVRKNYGATSFDYGSDLVASGSWSYGYSDQLTLQAHGELTNGLVNLGSGAAWQIGQLGVVSGAVAASQSDSQTGYLWQLGHYWSGQQFFVNTQATRASANFRDAASFYDAQRQKSSGRALAGYTHPTWGSLSGGLVYLQNFGQEAQRYATMGWSRPVGKQAYINVSLNHNLDDRRKSTAQVMFNWFLDGGINTGASVSKQNGETSYTAYANQSRPSEGGWGWSTIAQGGATQSAQARVDYLARQFEANAIVANNGGNTSAAIGASGALIGMGGHVFASRRIYDGFAVVSTNGVAQVPIKRENNVIGRTNDDGVMLVTQLGAYRNNKLSIDPLALPAQLRVPAPDQQIVPTDRAGTMVVFDIQHIHSASVILVDAQGTPLPVGSTALVRAAPTPSGPMPPKAGNVSVVGFDGATYFEQLEPRSTLEVRTPDGQLCQAVVAYPEVAPSSVPVIGPIACLTR